MDGFERSRRRLRWTVVGLVLATVAGMVALRPGTIPSSDPLPPLTDATVQTVDVYESAPDAFTGGTAAAIVTVELTSGPDRGSVVEIDQSLEGLDLSPGDRVKVDAFQIGDSEQYFVVDFQRRRPLMLLVLIFVAVVIGVSRWHGLRSLAGLGLSLVIVVRFVVPSILSGNSPWLTALVGATAVMLVTLYLSHGVNEQTTSAVIGTTVALGITLVLGSWFVDASSITGQSSEEALFAANLVPGLDLQGLVLAGLIIGALGVLDDVTVSQAATAFALHDADPSMTVGQVTSSAMRVGRDHIAATINTLFLAYAGASLALLVLFTTGGQSVGEIVTSEIVAEELVKTLVGSIGLIAAIPTTTVLAATMAVRRAPDEVGAR